MPALGFFQFVTYGALVLGACAPADTYHGRAHVLLEWENRMIEGDADTLAFSRRGERFTLRTAWNDDLRGPIAVDLGKDDRTTGRSLTIDGAPCVVQSGGLLLNGVQKPNPVIFSGVCRRGTVYVSFRFAFAPDRTASR